MKEKETILLLDAEFVQSYSISKSLKEAGYRVVIASPNRISYGFFSRFPDKKYNSPSSKNETEYREYVKDLIIKEKIDVVIPITNETAEILSRHYDYLTDTGAKLATMPWDVFIKAHDKERLMSFCESNNLPHPRTRSINLSNISESAEYVKFPAMIKPNISVGARGIKKVDNLDELKRELPAIIEEFGSCTLQQFIDNGDYYYNVMMHRNKEGNISATTIIEIQRFFPIKAGSSSYCVTINNPELTSICAEVLHKLNWIGFADFDVLLDKKDGFKIIEINPRLPASVHAAYAANINFPELIVMDLLGKPLKTYNYKENVKLRFLLMDMMWFLASPKRFNKEMHWFRFWDKDLFYQDLSFSDPFVFLAGLGNGLSKLLSKKYWREKLK